MCYMILLFCSGHTGHMLVHTSLRDRSKVLSVSGQIPHTCCIISVDTKNANWCVKLTDTRRFVILSLLNVSEHVHHVC